MILGEIAKQGVKLGLVLSLFLQIGCTQKYQDVSDTVLAAYDGYLDVELSKDEIESIPYASSYLRLGNQKQIFIILAFAELNPTSQVHQLKWVSENKAMLVTENGRLTKTLGLQQYNLAGLSGNIPTFDVKQASPVKFKLVYDWHENYQYGFSANVERTHTGQEIISTPLATTLTHVFIESVEFPKLNTTIHNTYWVDSNNNVIKTLQHLGPKMTPVELTVLQGYTPQ